MTIVDERALIEQAAVWMARLWAEDVTDQERRDCETWRAAHPRNEIAWQCMMQVSQKFDGVPTGSVGSSALLNKPHGVSRRQLFQWAGASGVIAAAGYGGVNNAGYFNAALASHRTGVGETRSIELADGTLISMNTDTALDVDINEQQRQVRLYRGEALVKTSLKHPVRELEVTTAFGRLATFGNEFSVRQYDKHTQVTVYEGAVQVHPAGAFQGLTLEADSQAWFGHSGVSAPETADPLALGWRNGVYVAESLRVEDLVTELSRYRRGVLICDPAIANLKVSGVFSVKDTDRALQSLSLSLPVDVVYRTRYWVTVAPRPEAA